MAIKVKFHLDSQKIEEGRKQRECNFSAKTVKLSNPKETTVKKHTHTTQHNGISQPTDLPVYSKMKNLFKAGISI